MDSWTQHRAQHLCLRLIPISVGTLLNALLVQFIGTLVDGGAMTAEQIL